MIPGLVSSRTLEGGIEIDPNQPAPVYLSRQLSSRLARLSCVASTKDKTSPTASRTSARLWCQTEKMFGLYG